MRINLSVNYRFLVLAFNNLIVSFSRLRLYPGAILLLHGCLVLHFASERFDLPAFPLCFNAIIPRFFKNSIKSRMYSSSTFALLIICLTVLLPFMSEYALIPRVPKRSRIVSVTRCIPIAPYTRTGIELGRTSVNPLLA